MSMSVHRLMLSSARNSFIRSAGRESDLSKTAEFVFYNRNPCSICRSSNSSSITAHINSRQFRSYFTNGDRVKREDPYAVLGLQWGDGSTTTEIKAAYKKKAVQLHPDVNKDDQNAHQKFQDLQKAYQTIMKLSENINAAENIDEWRWAIWNKGDRIAVDRTDVAGVARKRPVQPASIKMSPGLLGHPDGRGTVQRRPNRAEYLGDGNGTTDRIASSVGTGANKWVTPKDYVPWDGGNGIKAGATTTVVSDGRTANEGTANPPGSSKE
jgi:hypothetical protein